MNQTERDGYRLQIFDCQRQLNDCTTSFIRQQDIINNLQHEILTLNTRLQQQYLIIDHIHDQQARRGAQSK